MGALADGPHQQGAGTDAEAPLALHAPAANGAAKGEGGRSIFDIYTKRQKGAYLLVCSLGTCMVPVSGERPGGLHATD
mgnify:CR=1 FL=1